jgi:twitching motility protein PilT
MLSFGASSVVLASGEKVTLCFPAGDRSANQTTSAEDLRAIVEEVAPPEAMAKLMANQAAKFTHTFKDASFAIEATPREGSLRVVIAPAAVSAQTSPEAPVAPRPPPRPAPIGAAPSTPATAAEPAPTAPPASAAAWPKPEATASVEVARPELKAVERLLTKMIEMRASDLHLSSGSPPAVRVHGEIRELELPPYAADVLLRDLYEVTPEKNREEFEERNDTDFGLSIPGLARFRGNLFRDRRGPGAVFRAIPYKILSPAQIGLPPKVLDLCFLTKGLVLVTGPTGSGKSTTLATMINHANEHRRDHIITIEDPIEFLHKNRRCIVHQREVHAHTRSFKDALRAALREDPDIVLVGEMRDLETIAIAVETAETGHLVFGTLHTSTAPSTVDRIIDQFPADRQEQIRQMLAESLRGVISQTLCKRIGGGRVAAYEILFGSSAVANIIRERKTFQLFSHMQTGRAQGMTTLNDSLVGLVKEGIIEPREAWAKAMNRGELKSLFAREGIPIDEQE